MDCLENNRYHLKAPTEQHAFFVVLMDTSPSVADYIQNEIEGYNRLRELAARKTMDGKRIDGAVLAFNNHVEVLQSFRAVEDLEEIHVEVDNCTYMGEALREAYRLIEERKAVYKRMGTAYVRPWIFLITDGEPNDPGWEQVFREMRRLQEQKKVVIWVLGVSGYKREVMRTLTDRLIELEGKEFEPIFEWLSCSIMVASQSVRCDHVSLPDYPANAHRPPDILN